MVDPPGAEDVGQLRQRPGGPHHAEQGQEDVPRGQQASHLKSGPAAHPLLAAKDQEHVDARGPQADLEQDVELI